MTAARIPFVTCLTLLIVSSYCGPTICAGAERGVVRKPVPAAELAAEFSRMVDDLEGTIGGDPAIILDQAEELLATKVAMSRRLNEGITVATEIKEPLQVCGKRIIDPSELIPLVQALGEVSMRLHNARHWAGYAVKSERKEVRGAQLQARARNEAEIRRAYAEYAIQVERRQLAMHELWGITTGRRQVVVREYRNGAMFGERQATYGEALMYMANLEGFAAAPILVRPPQRTRQRDIHPSTELRALAGKSKNLDQLCELVDSELKAIANVHTQRLGDDGKGDLAGDRLMILASTGWWNNKAGWEVLLKSLDRPMDTDEHRAALAALERMRCNEEQLKLLATHEHADVRWQAIQIAAQRMQEFDVSFRVLRVAMKHDDAETRRAAYAALPRVFELAQVSEADQPNWLAEVFTSRNPPVVLDGIHWLKDHTTFKNPAAIKLFIQQARNKRNQELQAAAIAALDKVGAIDR